MQHKKIQNLEELTTQEKHKRGKISLSHPPIKQETQHITNTLIKCPTCPQQYTTKKNHEQT